MPTGPVVESARLIRNCRWCALATTGDDGAPLASQVAVVPEPGGALLLHLSRLAEHTRNLIARPVASVVLSEADDDRVDPQTLARLSARGAVSIVAPDSDGHAAARAVYLARLPEAEQRFGFGDFVLLRLVGARGHYVGGFARAFALDADAIAEAIRLAAGAER